MVVPAGELRGVLGITQVKYIPKHSPLAVIDASLAEGFTWDEKLLDQWLADPDALVPGNNMEFHVANSGERRELIRFLKTGGV